MSEGRMCSATGCGLTRRRFLGGCAACAAAGSLSMLSGTVHAAEQDSKTRIRIIYSLHEAQQTGPDWPNKGFDFRPVMQTVQDELIKRCPGFEFTASLANGPEQAKSIVEQDKAKPVDGYLVYQMNCWNQVVQTVAATGKPVLYADFQYGGSGGFLVYTAGFIRRQAPNVGFIASSRIEDLAEAVLCFSQAKGQPAAYDFAGAVCRVRTSRTSEAGDLKCTSDTLKTLSAEECVRRMKAARILAVQGQNAGGAEPVMGIPLEYVSFAEVNEAWEKADKDQAREVARRWRKNAAAVIDVSDETLDTSAAMYLGMKAVLKKHEANAITVNCLGGFYGGHIHAYPCLGFHELANEGLVGACECDIRSTASMLLLTSLTQGRPGYISDPVIDTSKRQIIYAHCVASNKAFGPGGQANPFTIMTHSEDRQGASVRSVLPEGYMTTTIQIEPARKEILFHQGKAVGNDPDDRACRTKLAVEPVGDIEKLFTQWDTWGWHRVTCYGDLKTSIYALADAMGWKMVEEA
ncbi:MAG TPA: twin-arginine translocation signal domain-containing protein [Anaerohalosphaeraceae bacterium]|nr:twin-arginine translocation signal domain-containing protein [Anaerohalosphaeraceae bacterium]